MLQEIEDAKTGPAPPNYPACKIYSNIKRLLTSFREKLQAEDVSEQKAKAKMEDMFKDLICVSANEVLRALVTRKSLYECSPGKVQVSQTGVKGSLSHIFRIFVTTTSTEEFIALDRVIKLLCTEVTHMVNSVLKDNCGFERVLLVGQKDYSTPRRTLCHIAANAPMFLPHMTFSDQWEKLLEAEISKGLTERELKSGVLDSENKETEQERVMSEFSERNPSPGQLHVSAEPLMEQIEVKQEKGDILSLGELMLQFDSLGAPHDETETQLKTEQTSSCEPVKNQEPSPQSCLNQEPAPQSCLNQEPAPQSSLTKGGPKMRKKQKPAKDLQGGLEKPKTPIESFSTSERGNSPSIAPAQVSLSNTETQQVESIRNTPPSDE
uniref:Uncharacterized protein n=1 Tax=Knipowitschia caucasica TaxID=637954 RepID=A0AAV2KZI1_KNICA